MLRAMENLLHTHLENDIRMGAHPDSAGSDISQHRIEDDAISSVGNWIHPYEHAIELQELLADFVHPIVGIDRRLCVDAPRGKRLEYPSKSIVMWRCVAPRLTVSAPEQRQLAR